jgi:hypothetical protein
MIDHREERVVAAGAGALLEDDGAGALTSRNTNAGCATGCGADCATLAADRDAVAARGLLTVTS